VPGVISCPSGRAARWAFAKESEYRAMQTIPPRRRLSQATIIVAWLLFFFVPLRIRLFWKKAVLNLSVIFGRIHHSASPCENAGYRYNLGGGISTIHPKYGAWCLLSYYILYFFLDKSA
jgi:hypothetical protein